MDYLPFILTVWDETNARMKAQEVGGGVVLHQSVYNNNVHDAKKNQINKRTCPFFLRKNPSVLGNLSNLLSFF